MSLVKHRTFFKKLLKMQVIFGHRWRHLEGEKDFWEHLGGIDATIDPSSFGQANTQVKKKKNKLLNEIIN
jgi:hypothetical protein